MFCAPRVSFSAFLMQEFDQKLIQGEITASPSRSRAGYLQIHLLLLFWVSPVRNSRDVLTVMMIKMSTE